MNPELTLLTGAALLGAYALLGADVGFLAIIRAAILFLAIMILTGCTHYSEGGENGVRFTAVGGVGTVQRTDPSGQLIVAYDNKDSFKHAMTTAGTLGTAAIWANLEKAKVAADQAVAISGIESTTTQALSADDVAKAMSANETSVALKALEVAE